MNKRSIWGNRWLVGVCIVPLVVLSGCGNQNGNLAPVSGTVTFAGEPVSGIEVVFSPIGEKGNMTPGPVAFGMTDAEGKFVAKTHRTNKLGATIGPNMMDFQYPDVAETALSELQAELRDSGETGEDPVAIKAQIVAMKKKLAGLVDLPASGSREFVVSPEGHTDLIIDLSKDN